MTSWPVYRATHQPLRRHDFTEAYYATRPNASRKGASARSVPVRQALLVAFEIALGLLWVGVTFACPGARRMVGSTGVCRIDDNHTVAAVVIHSAHIHLGGDGRS